MLGYYKPIDVLCEDNGKVVKAEVVNMVRGEYMNVDLGGMKLSMQWNKKLKEFRTRKSGLDFIAGIPESY
jgi:hypothetical protein